MQMSFTKRNEMVRKTFIFLFHNEYFVDYMHKSIQYVTLDHKTSHK